MKRRWMCEWGGMKGEVEAETRSKARYRAYLTLREVWGLRRLIEIRVTVPKSEAAPVTP